MAIGSELVMAVASKVQDPGIDDSEVYTLINECLLMMAADLDLSHLNSVATVTTVVDADAADLPAGCTQGIYLAKVDGVEVDVYDSWASMYLALSEESGEIKGVAVDGDTLRYLPIPADATEITIYYHRAPTAIKYDTEADIFTGRERVFGEKAMVHYAAMMLFDDIEDGIEGAKVNTARHKDIYETAWRACKDIIMEGPTRPKPPRNVLW